MARIKKVAVVDPLIQYDLAWRSFIAARRPSRTVSRSSVFQLTSRVARRSRHGSVALRRHLCRDAFGAVRMKHRAAITDVVRAQLTRERTSASLKVSHCFWTRIRGRCRTVRRASNSKGQKQSILLAVRAQEHSPRQDYSSDDHRCRTMTTFRFRSGVR